MGETSQIGWTDATWNPVIGCSKVSEGCHNCYAESMALRYKWSKHPWAVRYAAENVQLKPHKLRLPLTPSWQKEPKMVFVNSLSDVFHELIPRDYVDQMFAVMAMADIHTFQVLTKRPERMMEYINDEEVGLRVMAAASDMGIIRPLQRAPEWPLPNVWLGTSVELQKWVKPRLDALTNTPARIRFISAEPLLGPLDLSEYLTNIDWVIVGGESGPNRRPFDMDWARSIKEQCQDAGVAFFMKQIGSFRSGQHEALTEKDGTCWKWEQFPVSHPLAMPVQVHTKDSCETAMAEWMLYSSVQETLDLLVG